MRIRRAIATTAISLAMLFALGGAASADPEWCDTGSPPPNDFRLRPTGGGSFTSSMSWLRSTTGGTLDLAAAINTLEGGVAKGMRNALVHARSWYTLPRYQDDDDDDDD